VREDFTEAEIVELTFIIGYQDLGEQMCEGVKAYGTGLFFFNSAPSRSRRARLLAPLIVGTPR
jgi:hypothetical protein